MLDRIISGGMVIDGTGAPARRADVGISGGRIVAVGAIDDSASTVIDATDRVVAPGFIDVHTHLDAQAFWDPALTPSSLHGVTTAVGGNCGFTVAPIDDASGDYVMRMLSCVEGMPVESLEAALDFRWGSFGEWLDRLDGTLALNTGFLVGHSTVRRLVMGDRWRERPTGVELRRMAEVVDESIRAGALGFSSSWGEAHADHTGDLVPSRYAESDELVALASVLRNHPATSLEFIPSTEPHFPDRAIETMVAMSAAAGRPLNWNLLTIGSGTSLDDNQRRLSASDRAMDRGGTVIGLVMPEPVSVRINLRTTISYNAFPTWRRVMSLPVEARMAAFQDGGTRAALAAEVFSSTRPTVQFADMVVESTAAEPALLGQTCGQIAASRGMGALDAFLDVALADDLYATFRTPAGGDDDESWAQRATAWDDPRTLVGGSDAGAHVDSLAGFSYFTNFIGPTVRDRGLISLERAVHMLTGAPAELYGLTGRGRIAEGSFADVVVFDPVSVACGPMTVRTDLPGGAARLFADAVGIDRVLVNGVEIVRGGGVTGETPGAMLRSGRHTEPPRTRSIGR